MTVARAALAARQLWGSPIVAHLHVDSVSHSRRCKGGGGESPAVHGTLMAGGERGKPRLGALARWPGLRCCRCDPPDAAARCQSQLHLKPAHTPRQLPAWAGHAKAGPGKAEGRRSSALAMQGAPNWPRCDRGGGAVGKVGKSGAQRVPEAPGPGRPATVGSGARTHYGWGHDGRRPGYSS